MNIPNWKHKTAVVIASGPSLTDEQCNAARATGFDTIVVNATFKRAPWANILYAGDFLFLKSYMAEIVRVFPGKVWTQDSSAAARWPRLNRMKGANRDGLGRSMIHLNGNSGVQALNLAYLFGSRRIILLGFDMKLGPNGERHHHADHPHPMVQNQTFEEWLHKLNKVARDLEAEKCEVLNATPGSAMTCFPQVDWKEVLKAEKTLFTRMGERA